MKFCIKRSAKQRGTAPSWHRVSHTDGAFTLIETMIVVLLLSALITAVTAGIISMNRGSKRLASYTAALAMAEAKIHDVQAATYNPPVYPFAATNVVISNKTSIALDKGGTRYMVTGVVSSAIQPVAAGHLVTVIASFEEPGAPFQVKFQTLINKYARGQK